jgi:hypothetical protein
MSSILVPILIASFIGYQLDELKPKKYEMIDEQGEVLKVQFSEKGAYSCPLSCSLEHYHYATLDSHNDDSVKDFKQSWVVGFEVDNNGFNTFQINGIVMDSYVISKPVKKMPKQSVPVIYNGSN